VTGVDRDAAALAQWAGVTGVDTRVADLESAAWPLAGLRFDLVLVTNYLWRPLVPTLIEAVAPGGLLIYETFAHGQESVGRPSNPQFLLAPGELLTWVLPDLQVLGYEDGWSPDLPLRRVQHIVARRPELATLAESTDTSTPAPAWPQHLRLPSGSAPHGR
jgi:SAM-dependent methyltransferase